MASAGSVALPLAHEHLLCTLGCHLEYLGSLLTQHCNGKDLAPERILAVERTIKKLTRGQDGPVCRPPGGPSSPPSSVGVDEDGGPLLGAARAWRGDAVSIFAEPHVNAPRGSGAHRRPSPRPCKATPRLPSPRVHATLSMQRLPPSPPAELQELRGDTNKQMSSFDNHEMLPKRVVNSAAVPRRKAQSVKGLRTRRTLMVETDEVQEEASLQAQFRRLDNHGKGAISALQLAEALSSVELEDGDVPMSADQVSTCIRIMKQGLLMSGKALPAAEADTSMTNGRSGSSEDAYGSLAADEFIRFFKLFNMHSQGMHGMQGTQGKQGMQGMQGMLDEIDLSVIERLVSILRLEALQYRRSREESILRSATVLDEASSSISSQGKDVFVAFVIVLNAMVLGLQQDNSPGWQGWDTFELCFLLFFILEFVVKCWYHGLKWYFVGPDWSWNCFDFSVVVMGIFEAILARTESQNLDSVPGTSMIKMARLGRLARLVRLMRFRIFNELKLMIMGVVAGLRVLFWAIILFFFILYILGLITRQVIGDNLKNPKYATSFSKVYWAMFTIFRCFTDGCTADDGTPLQVHLSKEYGVWFMIAYAFMFIIITIGLFNLIMAIFVDNVTEANKKRSQDNRSDDHEVVRQKLRALIVDMCSICDDQGLIGERRSSISGILGTLKSVFTLPCMRQTLNRNTMCARPAEPIVITRKVFKAWLHHPVWITMLDDLEISCSNRYDLFDVIDADMSGELDIEELIDGLTRLRGPAEKKDAVAALLSCRVIQQTVCLFREEVINEMKELKDSHACLELVLTKYARTSKLVAHDDCVSPSPPSSEAGSRHTFDQPPSGWRASIESIKRAVADDERPLTTRSDCPYEIIDSGIRNMSSD